MAILTEAEVVAQLAAQHTKYLANPALVGSEVQVDQDARVTLSETPHTEVTNDEFDTLNVERVVSYNGAVNADVYTGLNVVAPVKATYMETQVRTAFDAGELFEHGGPYTSDYTLASPYVDGLTLIQGSLLTGQKFF